MSATVKRRQLVLAGLVVALGTAMFVNWYYTKPTTDIAANISSETTTENINLGDAQYVNGTAVSVSSDIFAEAKLKRSNAHDEAKSSLEEIINSSDADSDSKSKASDALIRLSDNIRAEADIENLIVAKTGGSCIVTLSDSAEVIVGNGELNDSVLTQILDIVTTKTSVPASKVTVVEAKQ